MIINGDFEVHTLGSGDFKNIIIDPMTTGIRTAAPHSPGRLVYDTSLSQYFYSDGSAWQSFSTPAPTTLNALLDVTLSGSTGNDILAYDGTVWTNRTRASLNIQTQDDVLDDLSALSVVSADQLIYGTGAGTFGYSAITAAGRALIDDVDATAQRTTLGLNSGGVGDIWLHTTGGTLSGTLDMSGNSIVNVANPISGTHAMPLTFADNRYINRTGDSMTGDLGLNGNRLVQVGDPAANDDAMSRGYADNRYMNATGGAFGGTVTFPILTTLGDSPGITWSGNTDIARLYVETTSLPETSRFVISMIDNIEDYISLVVGATTAIDIYSNVVDVYRDIDMQGNKIIGHGTATAANDLVTLGFSDNRYVNQTGDTMSGQLNMGGSQIVAVGNPTGASHAFSVGYGDGRYMRPTGATMSGELNMNSNRLSNLTVPLGINDAISLFYADNRYIRPTGATMSGELNMNSNRITNVSNPSDDGDAMSRIASDNRYFSEWNVFTMTAGQTIINTAVITATNTNAGRARLQVFRNGILLRDLAGAGTNRYSVTGSSQITLGAAATGGDEIQIFALGS